MPCVLVATGRDVVVTVTEGYSPLMVKDEEEEPITVDCQHDDVNVGKALLCNPLAGEGQYVWGHERDNVVDYSTRQLFTEVLNTIMHGSWTRGRVTARVNGLPGQKKKFVKRDFAVQPRCPGMCLYYGRR